MADGDLLPSYNALFPEESTSTVINGRRRNITINIHEVQNPEEQKLAKKVKSDQKHSPSRHLLPSTYKVDQRHDCRQLGNAQPAIVDHSARRSSTTSNVSSITAPDSTTPIRSNSLVLGEQTPFASSKSSKARSWDWLSRKIFGSA